MYVSMWCPCNISCKCVMRLHQCCVLRVRQCCPRKHGLKHFGAFCLFHFRHVGWEQLERNSAKLIYWCKACSGAARKAKNTDSISSFSVITKVGSGLNVLNICEPRLVDTCINGNIGGEIA